MSRWHVSKTTGKKAVCTATTKPCPVGKDGVHFPNEQDAEEFSQQVHEELNSEQQTISKTSGRRRDNNVNNSAHTKKPTQEELQKNVQETLRIANSDRNAHVDAINAFAVQKRRLESIDASNISESVDAINSYDKAREQVEYCEKQALKSSQEADDAFITYHGLGGADTQVYEDNRYPVYSYKYTGIPEGIVDRRYQVVTDKTSREHDDTAYKTVTRDIDTCNKYYTNNIDIVRTINRKAPEEQTPQERNHVSEFNTYQEILDAKKEERDRITDIIARKQYS